MTTAWQKLLAASELTSGTAWELLSNPKQGGGGGGLLILQSRALELGQVGGVSIPVSIDEPAIPVSLPDPDANNNKTPVDVSSNKQAVSVATNTSTIVA